MDSVKLRCQMCRTFCSSVVTYKFHIISHKKKMEKLFGKDEIKTLGYLPYLVLLDLSKKNLSPKCVVGLSHLTMVFSLETTGCFYLCHVCQETCSVEGILRHLLSNNHVSNYWSNLDPNSLDFSWIPKKESMELPAKAKDRMSYQDPYFFWMLHLTPDLLLQLQLKTYSEVTQILSENSRLFNHLQAAVPNGVLLQTYKRTDSRKHPLLGLQHLVECVCVGWSRKKHFLCTLCQLTVAAHMIIKHILSFDHIFRYFEMWHPATLLSKASYTGSTSLSCMMLDLSQQAEEIQASASTDMKQLSLQPDEFTSVNFKCYAEALKKLESIKNCSLEITITPLRKLVCRTPPPAEKSASVETHSAPAPLKFGPAKRADGSSVCKLRCQNCDLYTNNMFKYRRHLVGSQHQQSLVLQSSYAPNCKNFNKTVSLHLGLYSYIQACLERNTPVIGIPLVVSCITTEIMTETLNLCFACHECFGDSQLHDHFTSPRHLMFTLYQYQDPDLLPFAWDLDTDLDNAVLRAKVWQKERESGPFEMAIKVFDMSYWAIWNIIGRSFNEVISCLDDRSSLLMDSVPLIKTHQVQNFPLLGRKFLAVYDVYRTNYHYTEKVFLCLLCGRKMHKEESFAHIFSREHVVKFLDSFHPGSIDSSSATAETLLDLAQQAVDLHPVEKVQVLNLLKPLLASCSYPHTKGVLMNANMVKWIPMVKPPIKCGMKLVPSHIFTNVSGGRNKMPKVEKIPPRSSEETMEKVKIEEKSKKERSEGVPEACPSKNDGQKSILNLCGGKLPKSENRGSKVKETMTTTTEVKQQEIPPRGPLEEIMMEEGDTLQMVKEDKEPLVERSEGVPETCPSRNDGEKSIKNLCGGKSPKSENGGGEETLAEVKQEKIPARSSEEMMVKGEIFQMVKEEKEEVLVERSGAVPETCLSRNDGQRSCSSTTNLHGWKSPKSENGGTEETMTTNTKVKQEEIPPRSPEEMMMKGETLQMVKEEKEESFVERSGAVPETCPSRNDGQRSCSSTTNLHGWKSPKSENRGTEGMLTTTTKRVKEEISNNSSEEQIQSIEPFPIIKEESIESEIKIENIAERDRADRARSPTEEGMGSKDVATQLKTSSDEGKGTKRSFDICEGAQEDEKETVLKHIKQRMKSEGETWGEGTEREPYTDLGKKKEEESLKTTEKWLSTLYHCRFDKQESVYLCEICALKVPQDEVLSHGNLPGHSNIQVKVVNLDQDMYHLVLRESFNSIMRRFSKFLTRLESRSEPPPVPDPCQVKKESVDAPLDMFFKHDYIKVEDDETTFDYSYAELMSDLLVSANQFPRETDEADTNSQFKESESASETNLTFPPPGISGRDCEVTPNATMESKIASIVKVEGKTPVSSTCSAADPEPSGSDATSSGVAASRRIRVPKSEPVCIIIEDDSSPTSAEKSASSNVELGPQTGSQVMSRPAEDAPKYSHAAPLNPPAAVRKPTPALGREAPQTCGNTSVATNADVGGHKILPVASRVRAVLPVRREHNNNLKELQPVLRDRMKPPERSVKIGADWLIVVECSKENRRQVFCMLCSVKLQSTDHLREIYNHQLNYVRWKCPRWTAKPLELEQKLQRLVADLAKREKERGVTSQKLCVTHDVYEEFRCLPTRIALQKLKAMLQGEHLQSSSMSTAKKSASSDFSGVDRRDPRSSSKISDRESETPVNSRSLPRSNSQSRASVNSLKAAPSDVKVSSRNKNVPPAEAHKYERDTLRPTHREENPANCSTIPGNDVAASGELSKISIGQRIKESSRLSVYLKVTKTDAQPIIGRGKMWECQSMFLAPFFLCESCELIINMSDICQHMISETHRRQYVSKYHTTYTFESDEILSRAQKLDVLETVAWEISKREQKTEVDAQVVLVGEELHDDLQRQSFSQALKMLQSISDKMLRVAWPPVCKPPEKRRQPGYQSSLKASASAVDEMDPTLAKGPTRDKTKSTQHLKEATTAREFDGIKKQRVSGPVDSTASSSKADCGVPSLPKVGPPKDTSGSSISGQRNSIDILQGEDEKVESEPDCYELKPTPSMCPADRLLSKRKRPADSSVETLFQHPT